MTLRRYLPVLVGAVAVALVIAPAPQAIRVVAGVAFVLLIPGYALGRALVGAKGPAGETAVLSIALSLSAAGLAGLLLALFHDFGRAQIIAVLALIAVGAAAVAISRDRLGTDRQQVNRVSVRALAVATAATAAVVLILIVAFGRDGASAVAQQRYSSVALAAVRGNDSLKVEVIAGGTAPFSGTVSVQAMSSTLATWTVRGVRPGDSWTTLLSSAPAGALKVTLVGDNELRVLRVAPLASPS
jgi:hypothetical protein